MLYENELSLHFSFAFPIGMAWASYWLTVAGKKVVRSNKSTDESSSWFCRCNESDGGIISALARRTIGLPPSPSEPSISMRVALRDAGT